VIGCGDLVVGPDACVLFQTDDGALFFLQNLGSFVPGDRVRVFGTILQPANVVGSGAGQVIGDSQPWSTLSGDAEVNLADQRVAFKVRGLVSAGGNFIGTPRPITLVKGTVVCKLRGPGDSVLVDTPLVPLSGTGNADFRGHVPLPAECSAAPDDIAFLVRTPGGAWIANGAVLRSHR
jgi:hypothetical protein